LQYLLGCLGLILLIGLVITLIGWMFNNIIAVIGIGIAAWGLYEWNVNRKIKASSKAPGILFFIGLLLAMGWFGLKPDSIEPLKQIAVETSKVNEESSNEPKQKKANKENENNQVTDTQSDDKKVDAKSDNEQIEQPANKDIKSISAKVIKVTDGDTLEVSFNGKTEKLRLLLVDTPETVHPNKPIQPFGPEASAFAKEKLAGKDVELEIDVSERDKYGRLLVYLWVEDKMFNEMLLEKGLARVAYVYPPNIKYVDQFRAIQKKAQEEGIGIWSIENYAQEDGFDEGKVKEEKNLDSTQKSADPIENSKQDQYVYYKNCTAVREAGAAPIYSGDPGYSRKLDRDGDGVACE
jgi:micrococcal nuclease